MKNKLVKTLVVLTIVSIGFSVAFCSYVAFGAESMSHQQEMFMFSDHFKMAHSFLEIVSPISTILFILFFAVAIVFIKNNENINLPQLSVIEDFRVRKKDRLKFQFFNPRSPPKY